MNNARRLGFAFVDTAVQPVTSIENHVMAITDSWTRYSICDSVCHYLKRLIHSVQLDACWGAHTNQKHYGETIEDEDELFQQSLIKILKELVTAQIQNPRLFRGWVRITFNLEKSLEPSATQDILDTLTHMLEILGDHGNTARLALLKRYPEPMAHGPEACEPSHPCGSRWHRPSAGYPCFLIREIWNPIPNH